MKSCQNCLHAEKAPPNPAALGQDVFICKRYPPTIAFVPSQDRFGNIGMQVVTGSPSVKADDLCGEHADRPAVFLT